MTDELPEKLPLTSMDVAAEKRDELRRILATRFPEVVSEGKIDLDQLKRVLGEWVEPDRERFGLNWPGKAACMKVIQAPSVGTLKPVPGESVDWETTQNLFIEGDNLEVLKLLQKSHFNKVKLIYIDPPYNTGSDFIYPDNYSETLDTYLQYTGQVDDSGKKFSTNTESAGRYHSRWLNMMYPRLYLAKNLMTNDGVIAISIDDHEHVNLVSLCNMIFGEERYVGSIAVINNLKGRNDRANIATAHEYMVIYANSDFASYGIPLNKEQLAAYKFTDEKGRKYALRDLRKRGGADKREDRPNLYFPIYFDQLTGKCSLERGDPADVEIYPRLSDGTDGCWRWGKTKVQENLDILHPKGNRKTGGFGVEYRVYLDPSVRLIDDDEDEADDDDKLFDRTSKSKSFWWGAEFSTDVAGREFKALFDNLTTDYPKSPFLMERIIHMTTRPGDIVLDFFGGFSTTAHAIFNLAAIEGPARRFVMVQLPEPCAPDTKEFRAGFATIAKLSKERIRRAAAQARKRGAPDIDWGFRAFDLAKSCFSQWNGGSTDEDQATILSSLDAHADHILPGVAEEDLLFELLLKDGFSLTTPIQRKMVSGKTVYSVAEGALLICLDRNLTQSVLDGMADLEPARVICLDAGFQGNDQLKANAVQTFKARARSRETAIEFRTV